MSARLIMKLLKNIKSKTILDAGCGYCIYSLMTAERGNKVYAMDIDKDRIKRIEKMLEEDRELGKKIILKVGSIANIPFKEGVFDAIICSEVIEHIDEDKKAFEELSRVLKKDGILVLSLPSKSDNNLDTYKKFGHKRAGYSVEDVGRIGERFGLKIEKVYSYEHALGSFLFNTFNKLNNKIVIGALFYIFFFFYLIDFALKIGQENGNIFLLRKINQNN